MDEVVIVGTGAMAEAIGEGLNRKFRLVVVGRNRERGEQLARKWGGEFRQLEGFDISKKRVLLAVKPAGLEEVARKLRGEAEILISILAGKSLEDLRVIPARYYLRGMPNIGAFYNCSFTAIAGDREAVEFGVALFREIGEVLVVEGDDQIDIATAISGSGPAYLALIREAIEDTGVYLGLKREIASKLAKGLFWSFAGIEEKSCIIKERVMSPNGTTAEGIFRLEREGVRGKVMEAIIDGYKKAKRI